MKKRDKVHIDSGGGPVFLGKVNNQGIIKGRSDVYNTGIDADEAAMLFEKLFASIEKHIALSAQDKYDLRNEIEELRQELEKKEKANENFLMRRIRNIGRIAPDILDVTLATIINPVLGYSIMAKKIAAKAKEATA